MSQTDGHARVRTAAALCYIAPIHRPAEPPGGTNNKGKEGGLTAYRDPENSPKARITP